MTRRIAVIALALVAGCASSEESSVDLADVLPAQPDRSVSVAYRDLDSGRELMIDADRVVHAASTMKVPVMLEAYARAHAGELDLDGTVVVTDTFKSIVDGSPYRLSRDDDSELTLYDRVGQPVSYRELVRLMIVRSSNLATNLLVERLGADRIQATMASYGAETMRVLRGVQDIKAYEAGLSNSATARDLMIQLDAIATGRAVSQAMSREMIDVLTAQELNDLIPAGIPEGVRVAHKTGMITAIRHDAAIVYPPEAAPYVLVVLTKGYRDPEESARVIAEVSRRIWSWHTAR